MDLTASSSAHTESSAVAEKGREKHRRRIVDSISGLATAEEQIEFLLNRLADTEQNGAESRKEADQFRRENGKLNAKLGSAEKLLSKTEVAKSKLEQLCRELSKAQREEKEQNQLRIKQLQTVHAETVDSFKKSLADIQLSVEAKHEHNRRVADVEQLSSNFNKLTSDYEARLSELKKLYEEREADLSVIAKTKDTELSGLHSHIEEMQKRIQEVFAENVKLKKELLMSEDRVKTSIESEIGMRKLLDDYSAKYASLTQSLAQSNSSFDSVKQQMSKMNGNLIRMETEARKWKSKAEEAMSVVAALRAQKAEADRAIALKERQMAQLQELCRRLKKGEEPQQQQQIGQPETGDGDDAMATDEQQQPADTQLAMTTVAADGAE